MEQERNDRLSRVIRLVGTDATERLSRQKVILFGIGGVGSWTAEALVRTGVRHLDIVDADTVATSNINRQLPAMTSTTGMPKVEVLRQRLLDIAPDAEINIHQRRFTAATADEFNIPDFDYVIDAIDSLADKASLILAATDAGVKLFSSMGAAMKTAPTRIAVAEFWKVKGCPLAAALRRRFKKSGIFPRRRFKCVYSDELVPNAGPEITGDSAMSYDKVAFNGALCHITATFGMYLAWLLIDDVFKSR